MWDKPANFYKLNLDDDLKMSGSSSQMSEFFYSKMKVYTTLKTASVCSVSCNFGMRTLANEHM